MRGRILIAGGTGFIGSHVVEAALRMGLEVVALTHTRGNFSHSFPGAEHARILRADLSDRAGLKELLGGESFDYAVNCAGSIDHTLFSKGGRAVIEGHLFGLMNLVAALDRGQLKGFAQLGSSDECGGASAPQRETLREAPISPYSFAKAAGTHFLEMLHRSEGFPAVVLRLFLTYGPGQNDQRFIPQIVKGCMANSAFPVSAGEQLRDFCYVADIARGVLDALACPAAMGRTIHLASGVPVSIRAFIERIRARLGKGRPEFGRIAYRPGENMALHADTTLARELLGWHPEVSLEEGLERTIAWISAGASG